MFEGNPRKKQEPELIKRLKVELTKFLVQMDIFSRVIEVKVRISEYNHFKKNF
jgi:hypothetical protein